MFTKTLAALSFAAIALADSETFGLVIIRSGSQYQYSSISVKDGKFAIGTDNYVEGVITDSGLFKLSDGSYAVVKDDGIYTGSEGSSPFSISGGYLAYDGSQAFTINNNDLVAGSGNTPVALRAALSSGSAAPDFSPKGGDSPKKPSSNSSNDTTTTTHTITYQTANGANALTGAGMGAAIAAAAAFLI
ncbi:CYFA0S07e03884g1_1 [Cyberlindnera fabianii]|uniref:CYFA0S07e03884g1_1 n=1 Tax=Cyberlindnera fabianii TaxID=36022 RepID=A0A061B3L1_CYBFA|nr:CYFA0S07e03884g1_1 [Cyberlindnera fabianii]